ncbi:SIN3-like 4 [Artemisia annua]|uniref:SIN3-like 4 n=1 Tax=Artemisia annua TaxID=35608 RepID=A0A2U1MES1_ARTAN|nr:SIN3-like 4 [Artemisia annua]
MYREEHKGINEVYQEVASLFDDNPILPHEFPKFLPEASASASAYQTSLRNSYQCYDERSSGAEVLAGTWVPVSIVANLRVQDVRDG